MEALQVRRSEDRAGHVALVLGSWQAARQQLACARLRGMLTTGGGRRDVLVGVLPLLERLLGLEKEFLRGGVSASTLTGAGGAYAELAGVRHIFVGLKEVADVQGLHAKQVTADGPAHG